MLQARITDKMRSTKRPGRFAGEKAHKLCTHEAPDQNFLGFGVEGADSRCIPAVGKAITAGDF
jgi:hypothetical protein